MATTAEFLQTILAIGIFVALVAVVLFIVGRLSGRRADRIVALVFAGPP